jgi:hypothetical protein
VGSEDVQDDFPGLRGTEWLGRAQDVPKTLEFNVGAADRPPRKACCNVNRGTPGVPLTFVSGAFRLPRRCTRLLPPTEPRVPRVRIRVSLGVRRSSLHRLKGPSVPRPFTTRTTGTRRATLMACTSGRGPHTPLMTPVWCSPYVVGWVCPQACVCRGWGVGVRKDAAWCPYGVFLSDNPALCVYLCVYVYVPACVVVFRRVPGCGLHALSFLSWFAPPRSTQIGAGIGTHPKAHPQRSYVIVLHACVPPTAVSVNGEDVPYDPALAIASKIGVNSWHYDGTQLAVVVNLFARFPVTQDVVVVAHLPHGQQAALRPKMASARGIIARARLLKPALDNWYPRTYPVWQHALVARCPHRPPPHTHTRSHVDFRALDSPRLRSGADFP